MLRRSSAQGLACGVATASRHSSACGVPGPLAEHHHPQRRLGALLRQVQRHVAIARGMLRAGQQQHGRARRCTETYDAFGNPLPGLGLVNSMGKTLQTTPLPAVPEPGTRAMLPASLALLTRGARRVELRA